MLNRFSSPIQKCSAISASAPVTVDKNIIVLGAGQSNMEQWATSNGDYMGKLYFEQTLHRYNPRGTNIFIEGANSGSHLSRKSCLSYMAGTGTSDAVDYWVDDTVTPFVAGPRLTECLASVISAGYTYADINHLLWSQGEADAVEHYRTAVGNDVGGYKSYLSEYWDCFVWLKDYFFATFPNLNKMNIRPLGRHPDNNSASYGPVRLKQQLLAATYPSQVRYGSEVYDLPSDDSRHRTPEGFAIEGTRAAYEILAQEGLWTGNTVGPQITGISYNGASNTVVLTVTHDKGTSLRNYDGVVYTGSGAVDCNPTDGGGHMVKMLDPLGNTMVVSSVQITDYDKITIQLSTLPGVLPRGNSLVYADNNMFGSSVTASIFDNDGANPLPVRSSYSATVDGTANMATLGALSNVVALFTPENSYNVGASIADGNVWTKRAGTASSARRDDSKPVPFHTYDISTVYSGARNIPGWVFQGVPSQKLLVEHDLTTSDNYTLVMTVTCDDVQGDLTASTSNVALGTSTVPGTGQNPFMMVRQPYNALDTLQAYCGNAGETINYNVGVADPQVVVMRKSGNTITYWNKSAQDAQRTNSATLNAPDTDGGIPVFAIGNIPLKGSGSSDLETTFRGAVHHIYIVKSALSDADCVSIRNVFNQELVDLRGSQTIEAAGEADAVIAALNPAIWMDAQHAASFTLSGDLVVNQTSRVNGLQATQATAANQPKRLASGINGKPAVQFNHSGAASSLVMNDNPVMDWAGGDLFHLLVFMRDSDSGLAESVISKFSSGNQREWSLSVNNLDRWGMTMSPDGLTGPGVSLGTALPVSKPSLAAAWRQSSDGKMYVKMDTNAGRYEQLTGVTLSAVFNGTSPISYGTRASGLSDPFVGRIGEHLMFTYKPTAVQESDLMVALYRKWRIR